MLRIISFLMAGLFFFAGCMNIDDYRKERIEKADKAFKKIKDNKFPENAVLSLPFCIELALKNNLDLKVYELKEAVDKEKKTAAVLGMLPDLVVANDVAYRTNEPGAKSIALTGANAGQQSLAYSKSTDPFENRVRAELLFSAIDFGLAFCNYIQQDDRGLLTTEQKRRAAQNLILDVTTAYFRVAAAQYAMETTEKMIALSVETEQLLQDMARRKTVPLVSVLEENKKFIVLKKSLMEYKRSYQNSCIELRSLMGYYPTSEIKVDTSAMNELTELIVPGIELLEEAALIERPELYQLDIQKHITLIEARKTIITMFPNVQIFLDFTNSTNPFLYHYSWWEVGARAAYNLLKLPQKIEHYYALDTEEEQIKAQAVALSVGILAQVRIAHANLIEVKERYELAEDLYEVYEKHEEVAEIQSKSAGALSKIDLSRIKIEAAQRAIERTQALGNYYLSYFRLLNAVGVESFDRTELEKLRMRIEESINENIKDELNSDSEYKKEIAKIQENIDKNNIQIQNYNLEIQKLEEKVKASEASSAELREGYELGHNSEVEKYNEKLAIFENVIVGCKKEIAELKTKLDNTKSQYVSSCETSKVDLDSKTTEFNDKVVQYKEEIEKTDELFKNTKDDNKKSELKQKLDSIKVAKKEAIVQIEQFKDDYDDSNSAAEDKYKNQFRNYKLEIEKAEDRIEIANDSINELKEGYVDAKQNRLDDYNYKNKEFSSVLISCNKEIKSHNTEIAKLKEKVSKLDTGKAVIAKKVNDCTGVIAEHKKRLDKYSNAIDLMVKAESKRKGKKENLLLKKYDSIMNLDGDKQTGKEKPVVMPHGVEPEVGEETLGGQAVRAVSNLNMEMQQQSGVLRNGNTISPEEYTPGRANSIIVEAQKDAANNTIDQEAFDPLTQNNIDVQTQKDAGSNLITNEGYNANQMSQENALNNQIQTQMNQSTIQPGRDGY